MFCEFWSWLLRDVYYKTNPNISSSLHSCTKNRVCLTVCYTKQGRELVEHKLTESVADTIKKVLSFQASFGHFLTVHQDFCLKLKRWNEQLLAHNKKRLKCRSPTCLQSKNRSNITKNVLFGQKVGQILPYPIAWTKTLLEPRHLFLQWILRLNNMKNVENKSP